MTIPNGPGGGSLNETGNVQGDIPCRKCGYSLRSLAISGRCPECGTPVGVSVYGELLRYSDPEFVETLRKGVSLILWSILLTIVGAILGAIAQAAGMGPVSQVIILAACIPSLIGGWWLTAPDPSGIGEDRYGTARQIIRVSLVVGAVNALLNFVLTVAGSGQPIPMIAIQGITLIAGIIAVVGQFAQLNYLQKLAVRIPDESLSQRAHFLMWAIAISYGVLVLFGFLAAISIHMMAAKGPAGPGPGAGGIFAALGCFAGCAGLALIVFAVMYIFMLGRFGRQFKEQAALARQLWSTSTGQGAAPTPD